MTTPSFIGQAPDRIAALFGQAMALHRGGQLAGAEELYKSVLAVKPDHFEALHFLGLLEAQRGRYEQAEPLMRRSLEINCQSVDAFANHARVLNALKRSREALGACDSALALNPRSLEALVSRGNAWKDLGEYEQALDSYETALAVHPEYAPARANCGTILLVLRRFTEALASFDRLLAHNPNSADALLNRANALLGLARYEEAVASYDRACAMRPSDATTLAQRGAALLALGRPEEALASFDRALAMRPLDAVTLNHRGAALKHLQRDEEALAGYEQAIANDPHFADALYNRASLLKDLRRYDETLLAYDKARHIAPDHDGAPSVVSAAQATCDFPRIAQLQGELVRAIEAGKPFAPLPLLALCDDPALHLVCAKGYADERLRGSQQRRVPTGVGSCAPENGPAGTTLAALSPVGRRPADKLRIAYFSGDFCQHPVALLAVELLEIHDRSRFDVIGISFGPNDGSEIRRRLTDALDEFHDVRTRKDTEIAELIHNRAAHIVVDLTGYTHHSRSQVLSFRPAPLAVNYLGYPGTMAADFIDYVIADPITLPFDQQPFYSEKIVHLPDCYQVNDRTRPIPHSIEPIFSARRAAGLPEQGFVFCCFNNSHKITQPIFEVWMRLLSNVPGSVLWLLGDNAVAGRNLCQEARKRGVDPARLVFAGRLDLHAHLARHRLADLFLDTLPYNAHTTASDALWAGLPIITCQARAFAGRVAASLLHAVGLPELVTTSLADYEALAFRFARDPALLCPIRARLVRNRTGYPLFDTGRFRRHIETAYARMWEIFQRGEPPQSFAVEPIT